jgi:hypothetical protein
MNPIALHGLAPGDIKTSYIASGETLSGSLEKCGPRKSERKACTDVLIADWSGFKKIQKSWVWMRGRWVIMTILITPGNLFS